MNQQILTISDSIVVDAPVHDVFHKLIDPAEQVKWNSLYLEASVEPRGEVRTGSVMRGRFKGSGESTVRFEDVVADDHFVHYSPLKMFNLIALGEFRHRYEVKQEGGRTRFTQTVFFEPRGLGKLLKNVVMDGFKKRLPESFDEFRRYLGTTR